MVSQTKALPSTSSKAGQLLVIEDNRKMASFIQQGFSENGFQVDVAHSGAEGEQKTRAGAYDAVLLDIMLPDTDGVTICHQLRQEGITTPIIMLTALSSTDDKIAGLDAGADDYLAKPFDFNELMARVRAMMRRSQKSASSGAQAKLEFSDVQMDLLERRVWRSGQPVSLTAREFALLKYFLEHPKSVLSRATIGKGIWGQDFDAESNVIDVFVSMLRRKLEKGGKPRLIHTMVGKGYVLNHSCTTQ